MAGSPLADVASPLHASIQEFSTQMSRESSLLPSSKMQHSANPLLEDIDTQADQEMDSSLAKDPPSGQNRHMASESDDDSDIEIRRPMGRTARRMLGGSPQIQTQQSSMVSDEEDLYSATPRKNQRKSPSPPATDARSSLFMSPAKAGEEQDYSDEELPANALGGKQRLAALVAEKRAERLAQEAEEAQQRSAFAPASSDLPDEIVESSREAVNPEVERIMSDAAKPTRKASKKAMLDMERETQRMVRQQALAHQMKTKKKFTTNDLFAKFNYRPAGQVSAPLPPVDGDTTASSAPNSDMADAVVREPVSTPPSSPPTPLDRQRALVEQGALSKLVPVREDSLTNIVDVDDDEDELMDVRQMLSSSRAADMADTPAKAASEKKKGLRLAKFGKKAAPVRQDDSSDDELEIVRELPSHLSIFDRAKGIQKRQHTDSAAIHILKHLAHAGTDAAHSARRNKNNSRPSVNPQVLEAQLRLRAKEQARARQMERIAELKAKGIEVQTSEEREREAEEFENLLEKARQEAVDLRKAEKAADNEGKIVASDDESEDEDYYDGSENDDDDERDGVQKESNEMVDDVANESEDEEDEGEEDLEQESEDDADELAKEEAEEVVVREVMPQDLQVSPQVEASGSADWAQQTPIIGRKPRKSHVILDDEESDAEDAQDAVNAGTQSDAEDDDPFAAFGFGAAKTTTALMSPTQAFNATMQTPTQTSQQDSLDVLAYLAPHSSTLRPSVPDVDTQTQSQTQADFVPGSQLPESQQVDLAWETQAPETPVPGLNRGGSVVTIETPGWEPTQDGGLPAEWQAKQGLARENTLESLPEHDTQPTVRLRVSESPVASAPKRNRLVRGKRALVESSDEEEEVDTQPTKAAQKDAFREMAKRRKEALTTAEMAEAQREAKQMMDEQAEESEDEYAGLGGDDFVAPETDQDREMIDSSLIDVDERQIAAHFAERQRVADEAAASKLYKDLMTGGLRRKQANMFDLDDDEDDIAMRRRQMRQREEARKRKLLLQDDNIAGLAEGRQSKGKDAFLKAIADDDERDDDGTDLSDDGGEDESGTHTESQLTQQPTSTTPLHEISGNKRRLEEDPADRPPAKARRTKVSAFRAPTSLLEVQDSLSFLLDEPHAALVGPSVLDHSESESENERHESGAEEEEDDEDEVEAERQRQNDGGYAPDKASMPPPRLPASARRSAPGQGVVDRLSLKRAASTSEGSAHGRTAWAAPAGGAFKVPSLLRRATTNSGANERGVTTSNGLSRENSGGVKIGGTKKSSLAYQARTEERKAILEAGVRRRAENTRKIAALRRNASSGFSEGMGGRFEE